MATKTVTTTLDTQIEVRSTSNAESVPIELTNFSSVPTPRNEVLPLSEETPIPDQEYPTGAKLYFILLTLIMVMVLASLDINMVATAVPAITDHFHTVADIGWYSAAYRLMSCSFQFLFGKLYKMFSIKYTLLVSVVIFVLGSIVSASATSSKMLVVGRAICGLGCAGGTQGLFTVLIYIMPLRKRSFWNSMLGALEQAVAISGPLLGGVITQYLSWRWCFWICVPIGGLSIPLLLAFISIDRSDPELELPLKEKIRRLDLLGTLFFVPSMTCLFLVLGWAGTQYSWSSGTVIGLLVTFVALLAAFMYDQYHRGDDATIPLRLIRNRNVIAAFVFSLTCVSSVDVIEYYVPTYFQSVHGYSPSRSGYMLLPLIGGCMTGMLIGGSGTAWLGYYTPFMLLTSVLLPIASGLMTTWKVHTQLPRLIAYPAFVGLGGYIGLQAPQIAVQKVLPTTEAPLGIAVVMFAQNFGPALFISLAQTIFATRLKANFEQLVPGIDANSIENMGLSDLRATLGAGKLENALLGFDESLRQTWYLSIGLSCVTMIGSLLMQWRSVKEKTN